MTKTNLSRISAWVDADLKRDFSNAVKAHKTTESKLLKLLLTTFLKKNPTDQLPPSIENHGKKVKRVEIGLTASEKDELHKRAAPRGMTDNTYVAALLRTHFNSTPYFSENELQALREANRQLAVLGKNMNQIAKALNISLDNAHVIKAAELDKIRSNVEQHRQFIVALVQENMRAWGGENNGS